MSILRALDEGLEHVGMTKPNVSLAATGKPMAIHCSSQGHRERAVREVCVVQDTLMSIFGVLRTELNLNWKIDALQIPIIPHLGRYDSFSVRIEDSIVICRVL